MNIEQLNELVKINYIGFVNEKEWPHFLWSVHINDQVFEYKTGIGHFTPLCKGRYQEYSDPRNKKPDNSVRVSGIPNTNRRVMADPETFEGWAHIPSALSILDCLVSDSRCGDQSFESFCSELGYSDDSIKAFETYRACQKSGDKLKKALKGKYSELVELIDKQREEGNL